MSDLETWSVANGLLRDIHPESVWADNGAGCWMHPPRRRHSLADAPMYRCSDDQNAELRCRHGIGQPDPQDAACGWFTQRRDVTVGTVAPHEKCTDRLVRQLESQ